MKVVLINKSDSTGGAAVVTRRLLDALRRYGIDARMLVVEKLSQSPCISTAASAQKAAIPFLKERAKIFFHNGFSRENLFKIDIASDGLPLWKNDLVKSADIICLNWINQGMLSLRDIRHLADMGKPIVWTMHDMWNLTGICHHAGECNGFKLNCGNCHLLGKAASSTDLSASVWQEKQRLYDYADIHFVAVSRWLAQRCEESSLMKNQNVSIIPNAFPIEAEPPRRQIPEPGGKIRILMGAARLDDPIKGLDIAIDALNLIARNDVSLAKRIEFLTFGDIRNPRLLDEIKIPHTHSGHLSDHEYIRKLYLNSEIVLSTSHYETLPGTLIEGQACGCVPVAFDHGGQSDIITDDHDGILVPYSSSPELAAARIEKGIIRAVKLIDGQKYGRDESRNECPGRTAPYDIARITYESVKRKFSADAIAEKYAELFKRVSINFLNIKF